MNFILRLLLVCFVAVFAATIFIIIILAATNPDQSVLNWIYFGLITVFVAGILIYERKK